MSGGRFNGLEWTRAGLRWTEMTRRRNHWVGVKTLACDGPEPDLAAFVLRNKLTGRPVTLAAPRSEAFVSWKKISDATPDAIRALAENSFPLPLDRLEWGWASLQRENETVGLFAAMPAERVRHFRDVLGAAGLRLNGIGLNFFSQLAGIKYFWSPPDFERSMVVLDLATDPPQITFAHNGFPLFGRSLSPLAEESTLFDDIHKSLLYVGKTCADFKPATLLLTNRQPKDPLLVERLSQFLNLEVLTNPTPWADSLSAIGQVLCLFEPGALWISRPDDVRTPVKRFWGRHQKTVLASAAAVLAGAGIFFDQKINSDETQLLAARHRLSAPAASVQTAGDARSVFLAVAGGVPTGVQLIDYTYDAVQHDLALRGRAADYARVSEFVGALAQSNLLTNVRSDKSNAVRVGDRGVVEFSIRAVLK